MRSQLLARRDRGGVRYVDLKVSGTGLDVARFLTEAKAARQLVSATAPAPAGHGMVVVYARVVDARPLTVEAVTVAPRRTVRRGRIAVGLAGVVAALLCAGYVVDRLVSAAVAVLPALLGLLFIVAVIAAALRRSGVCCPGLHCPGCGH